MPPPLSTLGVFHTFATVLAIYLGIDNLISQRRIDLKSRNGKAYFVLTAFGCISTIWLVARTGHYGVGHVLSLLIMTLLGAALGLQRYRVPQAIVLTTTLLLSMIPSVMETLTRLPLGAPLATGPEDGLVKTSMAALLISYFSTVIWQIRSLRKDP